MSGNPYLKPMKGFEISNLKIDESFERLIKNKGGEFQDILTDEFSGPEDHSNDRKAATFRTGGAVHAGCISLSNNLGREIIAVPNIKGEIYFLEPGNDAIQAVSKVTLQGSLYAPPVFSEGVLYCAVKEGAVYAVDTGLGEQGGEGIKNRLLWQKRMKKGILAEPVIAGKYLLIASLDGIYAFDTYKPEQKKIMNPVWGVSINGTVSTPVVDSGMLFIGSEDRRLFAFDYAGNKLQKLWEYELSGACRMKPYVSPDGTTVAAATTDGYIYAVDRKNGTYKWSFVVRSPVIGNIAGANINGKECMIFGADSGILYCLNDKGKKVWSFSTGGKIRTEPVVQGGMVLFGSADNSFYSLDVSTGREVFSFSSGGNIYGKPLILGNRAIFGATDGYIYSVNI